MNIFLHKAIHGSAVREGEEAFTPSMVVKGVPDLAEIRRIVVSLPENIIEEVDDIASTESKNRSDFIKEAIYTVLLERRRAGIREQMRQGYVEMAQINLTLAKDLCQAEEEATICYETKLAWSVGYEY